jgi:hypothetical protein
MKSKQDRVQGEGNIKVGRIPCLESHFHFGYRSVGLSLACRCIWKLLPIEPRNSSHSGNVPNFQAGARPSWLWVSWTLLLSPTQCHDRALEYIMTVSFQTTYYSPLISIFSSHSTLHKLLVWNSVVGKKTNQLSWMNVFTSIILVAVLANSNFVRYISQNFARCIIYSISLQLRMTEIVTYEFRRTCKEMVASCIKLRYYRFP